MIVLTGRKRTGKDTLADITMAKSNEANVSKFALADWFKHALSNVFKLPIDKFYSEEKDAILDTPIVITKALMDRLMVVLNENDVKHGYVMFSTSKWIGRQINSIRELLIWFGSEVVRNNLGGEYHCEVTYKKMQDASRKSITNYNILILTDARFLEQSKFFKDRYEHSYAVLIKRPGLDESNDPTETANDNFPTGYFFDTIINDGTLEDYEKKISQTLERINRDVILKEERKSNK